MLSRRFWIIFVALLGFFCMTAVALRFSVAVIYAPLSVDGGWAAYPALDLGRGKSAVESASPLTYLPSDPGVHLKYDFDDRSIRLFPLSLWFRVFGAGLDSCRFYSLVEYLGVIAAMAWFLSALGLDRWTRFLALAIYACSMGVLDTLYDLRPDSMLTMLALAGFALATRAGLDIAAKSFWLAVLCLAALAVVWPSAAIPLSVVVGFFALGWLELSPADRKVTAPAIIALIAVPGIIFLLRNKFNNLVFGAFPNYDKTWDVYQQIAVMWRLGGVVELFSKEFVRWYASFFNSGIFVLAWIVIGLLQVVTFVPKGGKDEACRFRRLFLACFGAALVLFAADPHPTKDHSLPIIPFLVGAAALGMQEIGRRLNWVPASLVTLSAIAACVPSIRLALECERAGYSNAAVDRAFRDVLPAKGELRVGIGQASLFPQLQSEGAFTLIDDPQRRRLHQLELEALDFLLINREYADMGFEQKFAHAYPTHGFIQIAEVGKPDGGAYLKIMARNMKSQDKSSVIGFLREQANQLTP